MDGTGNTPILMINKDLFGRIPKNNEMFLKFVSYLCHTILNLIIEPKVLSPYDAIVPQPAVTRHDSHMGPYDLMASSLTTISALFVTASVQQYDSKLELMEWQHWAQCGCEYGVYNIVSIKSGIENWGIKSLVYILWYCFTSEFYGPGPSPSITIGQARILSIFRKME